MEINTLRNRLVIFVAGLCVGTIIGLTTSGDPTNDFHIHTLEMSWWVLSGILLYFMFGELAVTIFKYLPKMRRTQKGLEDAQS